MRIRRLLSFPRQPSTDTADEDAMKRLQLNGDEEAFTQLLRRWRDPIYHLCSRMTGDDHLGEDLTQEVFARIYLRRHADRAGGKFSTWLWRIAINKCHDELRSRRRHPATALSAQDELDGVLDCDLVQASPTPDEATAKQDAASAVRLALQRLPETHRTVLVLRHYHDLKFREIAEVLELPEGTVKSRMSDALTQLERLLGPEMHPEPLKSISPASPVRQLMQTL